MTDEYEEHLRIKAIIEEQQRLLRENPKLKGKTDAQINAMSNSSNLMSSLWKDPKHRNRMETIFHDPVKREKASDSSKKRWDNPEFKRKWDEKYKVGVQNRSNNPEWRESMKNAGQKRSNNPEWRENVTNAMQKLTDSVEWREKVCKPISCDGVIYPPKTEAALALAPETRLTVNSKQNWFKAQMKKYPERFFNV